ncbi:hypothetical protein [Thermaerobacillus caldiproteolyticus]|uniref:hypothetical protein n=1 Tax=Thermaerobacillus caldiproteolyticus TaxID=247480 RepID=UPI0027B9CC00|nr:hypothetical protein [Anoxybacillus caldiproteolyticus]
MSTILISPKFDKTKWYRIDYEKLTQLEQSTVQNEQTTGEIDSPSAQNEQSLGQTICST